MLHSVALITDPKNASIAMEKVTTFIVVNASIVMGQALFHET